MLRCTMKQGYDMRTLRDNFLRSPVSLSTLLELLLTRQAHRSGKNVGGQLLILYRGEPGTLTAGKLTLYSELIVYERQLSGENIDM